KNVCHDTYEVEAAMPFICDALDRIADTDCAMEFNTSGVWKQVSEMNPSPMMLREIAKRDIPITLGADAHSPNRVAEGFEQALRVLVDCGFSKINHFIKRKRIENSIEAALNTISVGSK
ncbi:MAG: histidinol-phosphatase, partial [Planctomycetota bacterium]